MPNQREETKRMIGLWATPEELKQMEELCRRHNCDRTALLKALVRNELLPLPLRRKGAR